MGLSQHPQYTRAHYGEKADNDNDNDNDTLREVPHPSNEGLALQARVSGPWPHKKESVLLVELTRWQGVQVHPVKRLNVGATVLEMNSSTNGDNDKHESQAIAVLNSRIIH